MNRPIHVQRLLNFSDIAPDLVLIHVSIDWDGNPIMLFDEGRPAAPIDSEDMTVRQRWHQIKPVAHHVIRYRSGGIERYRFENITQSSLTQFVQPLGQDWLLVDGRGGHARVHNTNGSLLQTLDLGDAIENLQTTKDGLIWVGYFDEGVFGKDIGNNGLVCFDSKGMPKFLYGELALSVGLPPIYDCYALNVCEDRVWLSYYNEFPLICLENFQITRRLGPEASFKAFAIRDQELFFVPAYGGNTVASLNLESNTRKEFDLVDSDGFLLKNFRNRSYKSFASNPERLAYYKPFDAVGRHSSLYLFTEESLYLVP